jgi:Rho-related BTB domain-containing protein 1/2
MNELLNVKKYFSLCNTLGLFADVMFELDDGSVPAHKAILTARCDVMKAMFSGDFRESSAKVVSVFNCHN